MFIRVFQFKLILLRKSKEEKSEKPLERIELSTPGLARPVL